MIVTNRWGQRMFDGLVVDVRRDRKDRMVLHVLTHARATHYRVVLEPVDVDEIQAAERR